MTSQEEHKESQLTLEEKDMVQEMWTKKVAEIGYTLCKECNTDDRICLCAKKKYFETATSRGNECAHSFPKSIVVHKHWVELLKKRDQWENPFNWAGCGTAWEEYRNCCCCNTKVYYLHLHDNMISQKTKDGRYYLHTCKGKEKCIQFASENLKKYEELWGQYRSS